MSNFDVAQNLSEQCCYVVLDFFVDLILNHVFIKYNFLIELGFVFVDTEAEIVFDEELDEVAVLFDLFIAVDVDLLEELDCFF